MHVEGIVFNGHRLAFASLEINTSPGMVLTLVSPAGANIQDDVALYAYHLYGSGCSVDLYAHVFPVASRICQMLAVFDAV